MFNDNQSLISAEPCEDCISREMVHDLIAHLLSDYLHDEDRLKIENLEIQVEDLPSVTPKQKMGRWIKDGKEQGYDIAGVKLIQIMCDKCGFIKGAIEGHTGLYKFCQNCGAKMDSVVVEE